MGLRLRLILVITVPLLLVLGVYGVIRVRIEQAELLAENQRLMGLTAKAVQISVENALRDRQLSDMDGIQRLGHGEARSPLPVERSDELGRVAAAFNMMADHLDSAVPWERGPTS